MHVQNTTLTKSQNTGYFCRFEGKGSLNVSNKALSYILNETRKRKIEKRLRRK